MKAKSYLFLLILLTLCTTPFVTEAFELKVDPDISITEETELTNQNLYMAGLRTWFDTTHEKDIVSLAWEQVVGGTIFGDVFLFGDSVSLTGEYFDDVRVVANTVFVSGVTDQDLIITARTIVLEESAIVNGNTLLLANSVFVKGQILGQTQITANNVEISGSISAPSTITAQKLSLTNTARIVSEISYFSPQRALIDSGATIQRELNFNQVESITQNDVIKKVFFAFVSFWSIIKLIATLFMIFILTQLFRVFSQRIIDIVYVQKFYSILIGLACAIGIPILIFVLFASLVLIPVAFILIFVFGTILIILPAISAIIIASVYQRYVQKIQKVTVDFNMSALAFILFTFVGFLPFIGGFVTYMLYLASIGAVYTYIYEQVRRKRVLSSRA